MERHPAGCDPSSFRSLPTPARLPPSSSNNPPKNHCTRSVPRQTSDRSPSKHQDLLSIPGIQSALCNLDAVACDVVQPVTRYNRHTYLNRFNAAALQLAEAFIAHINQIRRREIQARGLSILSPSDRHPKSTNVTLRGTVDDDSEDSELIFKKRSTRLARKRPRPRYISSDEDEFLGTTHRKSRPRRSKEIRTNLNDDLAYALMLRGVAPAEKPQHLERQKPASSVEDFESSDEVDDDYDTTVPRVVRPLPFVRRRPLASDSSALTPFIDNDDDSTDTEHQRKEQARRSLKTVIYGPGKAEFTEKEISIVFPTCSKRRMRADSLVSTSLRPPKGYGTVPFSQPWRPPMTPLCKIPKDMIAKYINGTYWLSPGPQDMADVDSFPKGNGLSGVRGANGILAKQRFPSSDRETRDGDSGKASPATYVQSGSSTTGSPRAKKPDMQNGEMDIELGPSLSSLTDNHSEEQKVGKDREATPRKNGVMQQSLRLRSKAWKDLAPYGRVPQQPQLPAQALEQKGVDASITSGVTSIVHNAHYQRVTPVVQKKQVTPAMTNLHQNRLTQTMMRQNQSPKVLPQSQNVVQASPGRNSQPTVKKKLPKDRLQSWKLLPSTPHLPSPPPSRPAQAMVRSSLPQQIRQKSETTKSQQLSPSPPSNQMLVVARGSLAMPNLGLHHPQMSVQPQLSLQPQPTILTAVPVQISAHQAGVPVQQALHLQQYGQDPRMFSQWQLQNTAIPQTQGMLQVSPGYVGVNSVVTPAPHGPVPVQSRILSVPAGVPISTNALVPAGTTLRPDVVSVQANGVTVPAPTEPAPPDLLSSPSLPQGRQGNFNFQLQEQYQKHYEEMYSKHYHEQMKTLKQNGSDTAS